MGKPTAKVGDAFQTRNGECVIIEYRDRFSVHIRFTKTGYERWAALGNIKKDHVKDVLHPDIHGMGFVGIGKCSWSNNRREYRLWNAMLDRCYGLKNSKQESYIGCTVVKRWHNFQNFCEDIHQMSNWQDKNFELDKDLRVPGNKKYGPKYCSFVPKLVNTSFRFGYGVSINRKGRYVARYGNGRGKHLGTFDTERRALQAYYKARKRGLAHLAELYKEVLHPDVINTLLSA